MIPSIASSGHSAVLFKLAVASNCTALDFRNLKHCLLLIFKK